MHNDLMKKQNSFIEEELWALAWNASVRRADLYKKSCSEDDRQEFRYNIIDHIQCKIIPKYKDRTVTEREHYSNLQNIINFANTKGKDVLGGKGYKAGSAQKLLNLGLKYYWCNYKYIRPPHCPIDSIVLGKLGLKEIKWTKIITIDEYMKVIKKVKEKIGHEDLAEWELENYGKADK